MTRRMKLMVVAFVCMTAGLAGAQERFGGLTGTVMDATKAAVPGATVTATNRETGASRVTVSGAEIERCVRAMSLERTRPLKRHDESTEQNHGKPHR